MRTTMKSKKIYLQCTVCGEELPADMEKCPVCSETIRQLGLQDWLEERESGRRLLPRMFRNLKN